MKKENIVVDKSFDFALRTVRLYKRLCEEKKEFVLSKQVLKSGTSIGANIREAERTQSKKDFIARMTIALKEADETAYWLELLYKSEFITKSQYASILPDISELLSILSSIVRTAKECHAR